MPFNPQEITPSASINRVRIVDLPGLPPPYALRGEERDKTAYDLLGAQAVYNLVRERADQLELSGLLPDSPTNEIMAAFQACFVSENPSVKATAEDIRDIVHRRIAILLAVLPEWDDSYWSYWSNIYQIVVGGGLLRDHMGQIVTGRIQAFFYHAHTERKYRSISIRYDPYGPYWPLVGAACVALPDMTHMAVLDFGGTSVKTGIAHYEQGALVSIKERDSFPSPLKEPHSYRQQGDIDPMMLFQAVADRIADTIQTSSHKDSISQAVVSVASYIDPTGHPYPDSRGGYAAMQMLAPNLQTALAEAVSQRVGRSLHLRLLHDGTAAATAYPGRAVLVFGTAIGVGTHRALPHINLQASEPPHTLLD
jgi:hypothetical protein